MSYRILVAFDGSENSVRAADLAFTASEHIPDCEIELIKIHKRKGGISICNGP